MLRSEQGHALLAALMVVVLLTALGTAGLTIATYSRQASAGELDRTQALYVADAGIELAIGKLKIDPLWRDGNEFSGVSFAGGVIEAVYVEQFGGVTPREVVVKIRSTGSYREASRTVEAKVTISYDPFICCKGVTDKGGVHIAGEGADDDLTISSSSTVIGSDTERTNLVFGGKAPWSPGGPSEVTITASPPHMGSSTVIYGDVYTRGDVYAYGTTGHTGAPTAIAVQGDVWANGSITESPSSAIQGVCHENAGLVIPCFPANIDPKDSAKKDAFIAYYRGLARNYESDGTTHYFNSPTGEETFTGAELASMNGVYFVEGKALLQSGTYNGRVTVVASTYVEVESGANLAPGNATAVLGLLSLWDTIVKGSNNIKAVLLCGDTLVINGPATLRGSVGTWGIGIHPDERGGHRRCGMCCYRMHDIGVRLFYNEAFFLRYPPGFPYTLTINYWRPVN